MNTDTKPPQRPTRVLKEYARNLPVMGPWLYHTYLKLRYNYRDGTVFNLPFDMKMYRFLETFHSDYADGNYERELASALGANLKKGSTFYDVGANAGYFSLLAAACVGESGKVFAFEPHPVTATLLRRQFQLNDLLNTVVVQSAVSDHEGVAEFSDDQYSVNQFLVGTRTEDGIHNDSKRHVRVSTISLDNFVESNHPPDVIKIDVEGAEMLVVKGAQRLLRHRSPVLLVELHSVRLREEYHSLMSELGYQSTLVNGQPIADLLSERLVLSRKVSDKCAPEGDAKH